MAQTVLITGAGTGLGLETALFLAERGMEVYASILDRSQQGQVEAAARRRNVGLRVLELDVTDDASIQAGVKRIVEECGAIDAVVNNAGVSLRGYFEDSDDDEVRRTIDVNLFGSMAVTRVVLPHMRRARRGRLIFISSIGGRIGSMARTAYCASKFGLEGFAEALMQEVAPLGLNVSIVEPGLINTERWTVNRGIAKRALDPNSPYYHWFRQQEKLADHFVATSPTTPADVAKAVYRALTVSDPRLRFVVGRRARIVLGLRRYIPGEIFERLYFGEIIRRVIRPQPATERTA